MTVIAAAAGSPGDRSDGQSSHDHGYYTGPDGVCGYCGDQPVLVDVFDVRPGELDYRCMYAGCDAVFPVNLADPMEAHGNYLDHLEGHEQAECEEGDHG